MHHKKETHCSRHLLCGAVLLLVVILFFVQKLERTTAPLSQEMSVTIENVQQQIQGANYCQTTQDCVVLEGKCPFGCYITINIAEKENLEPLLEKYETRCIYGCIALDGVICQDNKCAPVVAGDVLAPSGSVTSF